MGLLILFPLTFVPRFVARAFTVTILSMLREGALVVDG